VDSAEEAAAKEKCNSVKSFFAIFFVIFCLLALKRISFSSRT
jgi:hypothetical protein